MRAPRAAFSGALPVTGVLLLLGLFAVTGSPPFGLFLSEFTILNAAIGQGHPWVAVAMLALLALIFVGMAAVVLEVIYDPPLAEAPSDARELPAGRGSDRAAGAGPPARGVHPARRYSAC